VLRAAEGGGREVEEEDRPQLSGKIDFLFHKMIQSSGAGV
jgi:hypothetical protein